MITIKGIKIMTNFKRALSLFLCFVMVITLFAVTNISMFASNTVWDGSIAESFDSGSGTKDDPYIIKTAEELAYLSQQVSYYNDFSECYFELGADIILNDTTNWELWGTYNDENQLIAPVNVWQPIGRYSNLAFNGHFDGKGHTVSGMYISGVSAKFFGLFGYVGDPSSYGHSTRRTVKNLNVEKAYVYGANTMDDYSAHVGGIVGYGDADNCTFKGTVVGEENDFAYVGGIVGYGDVYNSTNYGEVKGFLETSYVGGITAYGSAENCINYGKLTGYSVAGIASGYGMDKNCINYGEIHTYGYFGGIALYGNSQYCQNFADIYAYDGADGGGITYSYEWTENIEKSTRYCVNSGNIYIKGNSSYVAGISYDGSAQHSYNRGNIYIGENCEYNEVAGVVFYIYDRGFDERCFDCYNAGEIVDNGIGNVIYGYACSYDMEVSGGYYYEGNGYTDQYATPLSREDMKVTSSFTGWNFNRVWEFIEGNEYPYPTLRCFGSKEYCYAVDLYDNDSLIRTELVNEDEKFVLPSLSDKGNLKFFGWEYEGETVQKCEEISVTADIKLQAVWQKVNTDINSWDGSIDTEWQGSGEENDPYLITNPAELAGLANNVNSGNDYADKYFLLTKDIYLNDVSDTYDYYTIAQNLWTPIGTDESHKFRGNFDGNNHKISGIYIKDNSFYMGLFGYTNNGNNKSKIENVNIENSYVYNLFNYVDDSNLGYVNAGLLVGYAGYTDISNCTSKGEVKLVITKYYTEYFNADDFYFGGITGRTNDSTIDSCINYADVSVTAKHDNVGVLELYSYVGGIAGRAYRVNNSKNYGNVYFDDFETYYSNTSNYVGGICGSVYYGDNNVNYGKIYSYYSDACLAGIFAGSNGIISNCINNGEVLGYSLSAGIIGYGGAGNCVNNGKVTGTIVGGIAGGSSNVYSSQNYGELSLYTGPKRSDRYSDDMIGGIAAFGENITDCTNYGKIVINDADSSEYLNAYIYVGGIFGKLESVNYEEDKYTVTKCANYGNIESNYFDGIHIGGIGGKTNTFNEVKACYNEGEITVADYYKYDHYIETVGGIVGYGNVLDSYNIGSITIGDFELYDDDDVYIGGIVGFGSVKNSYNIGSMRINDTTENDYDVYLGGVIGCAENDAETEIVDSYCLSNCMGGTLQYNNLGTVQTSGQLSSKNTFSSWNFDNVWEMGGVSGYSYPNLRFFGSKNFYYNLVFKDGNNIISKQLLKEGTKIDFDVPYANSEYDFAYWEKDGNYFYVNNGFNYFLDDDYEFTAVWKSKNKDSRSWDGSIDTEWQGSGTEADPYLISTPAELAGLSSKVRAARNSNNYEGCYFKQTSDIYLNDVNDYSETLLAENYWEPIGESSSRVFMGNYDGNNFKIYGLYIKGNGNFYKQYNGLFGYVKNAGFKNITIESSSISHVGNEHTYFGGVLAYGKAVTFENCHNYAHIKGNTKSSVVGGIIGYAEDSLTINNSTNYGNISGNYVGGIMGFFSKRSYYDFAEFTNCTNYGKITATNYSGGYIGGILGYTDDYFNDYSENTFTNCNNYGDIVSHNSTAYCGGIVGTISSYSTFTNCVNYAVVTGKRYVGGILGNNSRNNGTLIEECINYGTIKAESRCGGIVGSGYSYIYNCENNADIISENNNAGGIAGEAYGTIYYSNNNGNISGNEKIGGIAGETSNSYISYCINNGDITASSDVGGITGYNSTETTIFACDNNGVIKGSYDSVGGISGYSGRISQCNNYATVSSLSDVGGIVGRGYYTVESNNNYADIVGTRYVGGIVGYGSAKNCGNSGNITCTEGNYTGGISGNGTAKYCYNTGNITSSGGYTAGILGYGDAEYCYNTGSVNSEKYHVGGIVGCGNAKNSYNTADIWGYGYVGGVCGDGSVYSSYNIGDVVATYQYSHAGALTGDRYNTVSNSYYLDTVSVTSGYDAIVEGVMVDSSTLASNTLEGFDYETIWTIGAVENYAYPTLIATEHEITYKVTFLDADGVTVLKEQNVRRGNRAYAPKIEAKTDGDYVYALDHWDGEFVNITSDTTVKAIYRKTEIIKFLGNESKLTVPLGYSKDNLLVDIESAYLRLLMVTTHDYQMKCDVTWDMSSYNPNASGEYIITGHLNITDSMYYEMAESETVIIKVTVSEGDASVFDESKLTYTANSDDSVTITGYSGEAATIRIPSTLDGHTVSAIGDNAFKDNTYLVNLYIPSSVKSIGSNAFMGNTSLVQVTLSEGLNNVDEYAFSDTALTNVTVPESVTAIGKSALGTYNGDNIVNGFVVYAYAQSVAIDYAENAGITYVSISLKTDVKSGITVTAEDSVKLAVAEIVGGDYFETADSISSGENDVSLFEIKLLDNKDEETQPGNMMTISVPVPVGFNPDNCRIYRINADGSYKDMNAMLIDGRLVFNTAHLSFYAIIDEQPAYTRGDINADGEINTSDLAELKLYLAGAITLNVIQLQAADISGDSLVDTTDLATLKLYLAGAISGF